MRLIEYILLYPELYGECNWYRISRNPNITLQDILNHPELNWGWEYVSYNPNITLNDVLSRPELPWIKKAYYNPAKPSKLIQSKINFFKSLDDPRNQLCMTRFDL